MRQTRRGQLPRRFSHRSYPAFSRRGRRATPVGTFDAERPKTSVAASQACRRSSGERPRRVVRSQRRIAESVATRRRAVCRVHVFTNPANDDRAETPVSRHMSSLRTSRVDDDADGRMPLLPRVQRMPCAPPPACGRLLRLLLIRDGLLSARAEGRRMLCVP
jgi:hypothetical protein